MQAVQTIVNEITSNVTDINAVLNGKEKISYNTSKEVRKLAQGIKLLAQDLRIGIMEEFKKTKVNKTA